MKRLSIVAALLGVSLLLPTPASAQVRGVYWTTSGFFGPFNIQGLIPSIPKEKARDITIPVSMWVIDHPKGLVVFDTGNNNGVHTAATQRHTHAADPVLAERIQQSLAAFGRTRTERRFEVHDDGAAYGVTAPEMVIVVYRPQQPQPLAQWAVGALAPDTVSRYVTLVGSGAVATIPSYQIDNLLALLRAAEPPHHHPPAARRR